MLELFGATVGLGLAGVDPVAAALALAALTAGASRRAVLAFVAITLTVPVALGVALSTAVAGSGGDIDLSGIDVESPWWAVAESVLAVVLVGWALRRWRTGPAVGRERRVRSTSSLALALLGVVLGVSFLTDPTYLAVVVLAGRADVASMVAAHVLWSLLSQAPLVIAGIAVLTHRHHAAVAALDRLSARFGPAVRTTITVLLVLAGVVLAADVATYVVTGGDYLLG